MRIKTLAFAAVAAAATFVAVQPAVAAGYPEKNITIVIPYKTGGGFDATVRAVAKTLGKYLPNKVNIIPKNLPGAGGKKAYAKVIKAKADGYTLVAFNYPGGSLPKVLGEKVSYDVDKFVWLARMSVTPYMIAVGKKSKIMSIADLKSSNRVIKSPQTGFGSSAYAVSAIVTKLIGFKSKFLTGYKGSKSTVIGVVRGDGEMNINNVRTVGKFVKSGDLRGLATFEPKSSIKGVPTIREAGYPELEGIGVQRFLAAPPGLPEDVRKILSVAIQKAINDPDSQAWAKKSKRPWAPLDSDAATNEVKNGMAFFLKHIDVLGKQK